MLNDDFGHLSKHAFVGHLRQKYNGSISFLILWKKVLQAYRIGLFGLASDISCVSPMVDF